MMKICGLLCLAISLFSTVSCDPCLTASVLQGQVWRSAAFIGSSASSHICDATIKEDWYRIDSEAGNDTITECPPMYCCGTVYPIWMNGTIPEEADGIVNRNMCVKAIQGCCAASLTIQLKNCGEYRVYKLVQTQGCSQAYCFGTLLINTTTSTTTTTTTSSPTTTKKAKNKISGNDKKERYNRYDGNASIYIIMIMLLAVIIVVLLGFLVLKNRPCRQRDGSYVDKKGSLSSLSEFPREHPQIRQLTVIDLDCRIADNGYLNMEQKR